jgi:hypothetical protein
VIEYRKRGPLLFSGSVLASIGRSARTSLRRTGSLGIAAAAVAAIVVVGASASASYSDAAGDGNEAPDITSVTVDDAGSGPVKVRVSFANFRVLPPNSRVVVSFDLDRNPGTGAGGDEITLRYSSDGKLDFFRWDGSQLIALPATGIGAELVDGVLSFAVDRALLAGSTSFGVLAVAARTQQVAIGNVISTDFAPATGRNVYSAPGPTSFPDPDNDHDVAPDITTIAVSDSTGGMIQFKLTTANYRTLPPDKLIGIGIDLAGRPDSDDALFLGYLSGAQTVEFDRERGGISQPADPPFRVSASHVEGVLTFSMHRSELDGASAFGFGIVSADLVGPGESEGEEFEGEVEALDTAPDDLSGRLYQYRMINSGPLHLRAGTVTASAGGVRAGKPFVAAVAVRRLDTYRIVRSGSVRCTASVAGTRVSVTGRFRGGRAECRLRVPSAKVGAVLRGTITVRVAETTHRSSYRFVVR